ncbi:hypothetical protein Moror_7076 [Moniliophthora roreri MCA 2997]|uniref:Uncharacterized protein n=1 Tax=Moniliophthora roreri (strain MCA 2997) TaxID=1381753 RepID=V2XUS0_MONRO|nr:hypothetical protein Moror_7076 [Moniliophthora roreri MCA 2997]
MRNAIGYGSFFSTGRTVREENSNKQSKRSLLLEGGVARVKPQRPKTLERHQTPAIKIERRDIVTVVSHAEPREHAARIMDLLGAEIMSQFANIQAMQACMEHVLNHARRLVKAEHGNDTSVYLLEQVIKAQFSLKADGFKLEETMIIIEKCRKHIDSQWTSGSLS